MVAMGCTLGWRVHPRERGGSMPIPEEGRSHPGPSPRARGKRGESYCLPRSSRSIPASAGEASSICSCAVGSGVHPRERGGSFAGFLDGIFPLGPSPRARGKRPSHRKQKSSQGSIPASAGEAKVTLRLCHRCQVHPRERGGSPRTRQQPPPAGGPSPRARGKRGSHQGRQVRGGSIPASAGEACSAPRRNSAARVHPRERGGSGIRSTWSGGTRGPSPRARGKHVHASADSLIGGSIPASAGEANTPRTWSDTPEVHPRERGGSRGGLVEAKTMMGPSPRARGKLTQPRIVAHLIRSIPASAGEARICGR